MSEEIDIVGMDDIKEALLVAYDYMKSVDNLYTKTEGALGDALDDELHMLKRALSIWGEG